MEKKWVGLQMDQNALIISHNFFLLVIVFYLWKIDQIVFKCFVRYLSGMKMLRVAN